MISKSYTNVYVKIQIKATRALIKFCVDHKYNTTWLNDLNACLTSLEQNEMKTAYDIYAKIPLGGNGCFNDWFPNVVFEHENREYVSSVFEALTDRWSNLMKMTLNKT